MADDKKDRDLSRPIFDRYNEISEWFDEARASCEMELPYLKKISDHVPPGSHILDFGCGSGVPIAKYFIDRGYKITGIDGSEKLINLAKDRFPQYRN